MYKNILVPLDGSELGEVVLPYVKELVGRLDLNVVLFHVYSLDERELYPVHRAYIERAAETVKRQSEEVRESMGRKAGAGIPEIQGKLAMGNPAEEILRYVEENGIDLILMATHGRSGVRRWAIGSVADKVLRASQVPVWLVRAGISEEIVYDKWPRQTILVPLDGSELAESALPHAEALAKQRDPSLVDIVLLGVCEPMLLPSYYPPTQPLSWDDHVTRCKRSSGEYLTKLEKRLKNAGLNVRIEVLAGKPAEEIIAYANKNPFNLIVMSTHGRSGISRWAFGSVAEKVLLGVSCPIFLVRPS